MRKTLCASVLALALCGSALAGDMGTPPLAPRDVPAPPSASQPSGDQPHAGSSAQAPDSTTDGSSSIADGLAATALTIFNSVLTLL